MAPPMIGDGREYFLEDTTPITVAVVVDSGGSGFVEVYFGVDRRVAGLSVGVELL